MERWQAVKEIFHEAVEIAPEKRAAFIEANCTDAQSRREVEKLLGFHEEAGDFINQPAAVEIGFAVEVEEQEFAAQIGRHIGSYRIVRELGRGGMGAVFLATRENEFNQTVALKIVKRGMDTDFVLSRFRHERQILASLNHPFIARLLDGGTTADNLPYFVMEFVDGQDLISFCEREHLNLEKRLNLFREVCSAVSYAHQNLVVHRDLKPSNVLVTAEGKPKLLDFGIAKLLQTDESAELSAKTTGIYRLLTPEYASPEQIRGERITTASDVYSLGVILYELLTAHSPYRVKSKTAEELIRAVCDTIPIKPSELTQSREAETQKVKNLKSKIQNPKLLKGDLDNITLKALQKEPSRRYASVEAFSEDIRRHLAGLPVTARADKFSYRAAKFLKRHRIGAFAAFLILLSLLAGISATTWQAYRANIERAKAEQRFADVHSLSNSLMLELHDAVKDLPGSTPARQLLIKRALENLDKLSQDADTDVTLQHDLAIAFEKVGDVQGNPSAPNLGDTNGALESYGKALIIREKFLARAKSDSNETYNTAMLDSKICQVNAFQINNSVAEKHCRQSLALFESLAAKEPEHISFRNALADSYSQMGELLKNNGNADNALDSLKKSINISQQILAYDQINIEALLNTRLAYSRVGEDFEYKNDLNAALNAYLNALDIAKRAVVAYPQNVRTKLILAIAYGKVGFTQAALGRHQEAMKNSRLGLKSLREIVANDPQNTFADRQFACANKNVGYAYLQSGDSANALDNFQRALAIKEKLREKDASDIFLMCDIGETTAHIGAAYEKMAQPQNTAEAKQNNWNNASKWYERSLKIWSNLQQTDKLLQYYAAKPDELQKALTRCDFAIKH